MAAEEVRDVGYLAWRDPWAWMEDMKGKRWEKLIQREKRHFHQLSSQASVQRTAKQMEQEIKDAQQYIEALPRHENRKWHDPDFHDAELAVSLEMGMGP